MINKLKNKYISRKFQIKFRIIDENIYCHLLKNKSLTNLIHFYSRAQSAFPWCIGGC